jgi:hypothetical protein
MMPYRNMTLMDSLDEFFLEESMPFIQPLTLTHLSATLMIISAALMGVSLINWIVQPGEMRVPQQPNTWTSVGFYDLRSPQTLTKKERAAAAHNGKNAVLYEKVYASGARAWRYSLDGYEWFYPTRTAIARRGLTSDGDILIQE